MLAFHGCVAKITVLVLLLALLALGIEKMTERRSHQRTSEGIEEQSPALSPNGTSSSPPPPNYRGKSVLPSEHVNASDGDLDRPTSEFSSADRRSSIKIALNSGRPVPTQDGFVTVSEPVQITGGECRAIRLADQTSTWCRQVNEDWRLVK
jgi:hypothetical protein